MSIGAGDHTAGGQPGRFEYRGGYERIKARGTEFTLPPTGVTGSTIAMLKDTCGNLIQAAQKS